MKLSIHHTQDDSEQKGPLSRRFAKSVKTCRFFSRLPKCNPFESYPFVSIRTSLSFCCISFMLIKDGAYYCYFAYVLRISRYLDFLSAMLTNAGVFLHGLKLCRESRS